MIKIRRLFGVTIITSTGDDAGCIKALSGEDFKPGDKVVKLPYKHHVHRNWNYPMLIKIIEDKERADADAAGAGI